MLGLVVQLGRHSVGTTCQYPSRRYQLTIFDLTGVHQVVIRYCECIPGDRAYRRQQLLKMRWFPATLVRPHTVFSFRLLGFFHQLQSQNKTNLYDFYNTIIRLSNSAGLSPEIVSAFSSARLFNTKLTTGDSSATTRSPLYIVCGSICTF
jgi:hypothetical protein